MGAGMAAVALAVAVLSTRLERARHASGPDAAAPVRMK